MTIDINLSSSDAFPISITPGTYRAESIHQLNTRLSKLPKDSSLVWDCLRQDLEAEPGLFLELTAFLAERGLTHLNIKETAP